MASAWLRGGGEVGALVRGRDWSVSPLGPPEGWPRPLRSAVALLLNSKFPMFVAWGPALGLLYNDAYAEILGAKHPGSLGAPLQDVWAEVWSDIRPLVEAAMGGEASYREDLPLLTNRHGYDEQAWFTFSYSPAPDDDGQVAGMFCAVVETTARVREEQRRAFLFELDERLRDLGDAGQILDLSAALLGEHLGVDRAHWAQVDVPQDRFEVGQEWTRPGVPGLRGAHRLSDFGAPLVAQMAAGGIVAVADTLANVLTSPERVSQAFGQTLRGALSVPLLRGGTWRAALCAHTVAPRLWREDERELVREAAERVWTRAERALAEARVRESEVRFRVLVNATSDVVYRASADWSELRQLDGRGLQGEPGRRRGAWIHAYVPADEQAFVKAAIAEAIRTRSVFELEHRVRHVDGTVGWIQSRAIPLFDDGGEILEWFGAARDVTESHRARLALEENAEQLSLATEAAEVGLWDFDLATDTLFWPPRMKQMFGLSPDVPVSMADFYGGLHPADHDRVAAAFAQALDPGRRAVYDVEYRTVGREDGKIRWVAAKGRGIFNDRGECLRVIGAAMDISVRKAAEQHLRLMVNELNHRVKNSLATVQGIAAQTLRRGEAPEEVREALTSRLVALAKAHDVLTGERWSGADLAELAGQAAEPYIRLDGTSPFQIEGPGVFLPPKTAIAMALAFHELATNAAKYGALSAPEGEVRIRWQVSPGRAARKLQLTWRESSGPPVAAPQRSGFGTRLIRRGLASELQGDVSLDYLPAGLVCTMDALLPDEPREGWKVELQIS